MNRISSLTIMSILVTLMLAGCASSPKRAIYNSIQDYAGIECGQQPPSDREQCEANFNKEDYKTYRRQHGNSATGDE